MIICARNFFYPRFAIVFQTPHTSFCSISTSAHATHPYVKQLRNESKPWIEEICMCRLSNLATTKHNHRNSTHEREKSQHLTCSGAQTLQKNRTGEEGITNITEEKNSCSPPPPPSQTQAEPLRVLSSSSLCRKSLTEDKSEQHRSAKVPCTKVHGHLSQSKPKKPKQKRAPAKPSIATPKACAKDLSGREGSKRKKSSA